VEIKNYKQPVIAPPNGYWFVLRPDGTRERIGNLRGTELETPPVQAQRNAQALIRVLKHLDVRPSRVFAYVLFPSLHPKSEIHAQVPEGVRVCTSIEDFLQALTYNEQRSQGAISMKRLLRVPQFLGLEETRQITKKPIDAWAQQVGDLARRFSDQLTATTVAVPWWKGKVLLRFVFGLLFAPALFLAVGLALRLWLQTSLFPQWSFGTLLALLGTPFFIWSFLHNRKWLTVLGGLVGTCVLCVPPFNEVSYPDYIFAVLLPFSLITATHVIVHHKLPEWRPFLTGWAIGALLTFVFILM